MKILLIKLLPLYTTTEVLYDVCPACSSSRELYSVLHIVCGSIIILYLGGITSAYIVVFPALQLLVCSLAFIAHSLIVVASLPLWLLVWGWFAYWYAIYTTYSPLWPYIYDLGQTVLIMDSKC